MDYYYFFSLYVVVVKIQLISFWMVILKLFFSTLGCRVQDNWDIWKFRLSVPFTWNVLVLTLANKDFLNSWYWQSTPVEGNRIITFSVVYKHEQLQMNGGHLLLIWAMAHRIYPFSQVIWTLNRANIFFFSFCLIMHQYYK